MISRNKRGIGTVYFALIGLIIAVPILLQFITYGVEEGKKASYLTGFYADDLGVLMEAVQAVPGNVYINYPLEKGYKISLQKEQIVVSFGPSSLLSATKEFHLLPGMSVEESEVEGVLQVSKQNGIISFSRQMETTTTCPGLTLEEKKVSVVIQPSAEPAGLTQEQLELFKSSFDEALALNELLAESTPTITIVVQSSKTVDQQPANAGLTLLRPQAEGTNELIYQSLVCGLLTNVPRLLPAQEQKSAETTPAASYEITLNFNVGEEGTSALVENRRMYAQALVQTVGP